MGQDNIFQTIELSVKALAEHEKDIAHLHFGRHWEEVFREDTSKLVEKI